MLIRQTAVTGVCRRLPVLVSLFLLVWVGGCSDATRPAGEPDATSLVNVFTGTRAGAPDYGTGGGAGNTYPGAVVPFGMLQWSPDTVPGKVNAPGGYSYDDSVLRGFSLTHVSGAGCAIHQDVPLLPTVEPVAVSPAIAGTFLIEPRYLPSFDHAHEEAEPGFYGVTLDPGTERATTVELSTTTRTGIGRIVFPATATASVLFNAGGSAMANGNAAFVIDPARREVTGSVESGQFCYHRNRYVLHFVARFDRPFAAVGTWQGETLSSGGTSVSATFSGEFPCPFQLRPLGQAPNSPTYSCGAQAGAYVTFDTRDEPEVRVQVAVSYVSVDAARDNLLREQGDGFDLEGVRRAAHEAWRDALGRIEIRGGEDDDRRTFYTMFYHALLAPTTFSDADGRYFGMDGVVHDAGGRTRYTTFSGWDVYRSQIPLLAMLFPERASDMMESLVANARESGWLPRWSVAAAAPDASVPTCRARRSTARRSSGRGSAGAISATRARSRSRCRTVRRSGVLPARRRRRTDRTAPTSAPRAEAPGYSPCASRNRSASIADMQPVPAAVIAWRYVGSCTSPQANTPGMLVAVERGCVTM